MFFSVYQFVAGDDKTRTESIRSGNHSGSIAKPTTQGATEDRLRANGRAPGTPRRMAVLASAVALGVGMTSSTINAQTSDSATVTVAASVIAPLMLSIRNNMDFGTMIPGDQPGTVQVQVPCISLDAIVAGPITHMGDHVSANFTATGEPGRTISVLFPSGFINLENSNLIVMTVDSFVLGCAALGPIGS